jgi:hypothetical protein
MGQLIIDTINQMARVESAETNKEVVNGSAALLQRTFLEISPDSQAKSLNFFYRQRTVAEDMTRWNIMGRYWWWTAGVNFTSAERGELIMKETERLFAWLRAQNGERTIYRPRRSFWEVKREFDVASIELGEAYRTCRVLDYERLIAQMQKQLNELKAASLNPAALV